MNIEAQLLNKCYGSKQVLKDISLTLSQNKIYGLLGRNGAGKTTLMQIVAGHTPATTGEVKVGNQSPFENRSVLQNICLINESGNFKKTLKVKDVLKIASLFYPYWSQEAAERLMEEFDLDSNTKVKALSKGMESALGIIVGLSSRTSITIFDEPYIGLDAAMRARFYELLLDEYEEYPRTFIISTHLIDEVSNLFEEVLIMQKGKLILQDTAENLQQRCVSVKGPKSQIEEYEKGKQVIHEQVFGGEKKIVLFNEDIYAEELVDSSFHVEAVHIQDIMIYLTANRGGVA
ncbi:MULTISPECIES: ABC transporter ATP-binding protein [Priestia]|uniref:ABC transporter ATP-binding protein n=1 Tax=Priestia TaxID=2800373 RepID=UPI0011BB0C72|nr:MULTISPECIES: ABC transporter ATP-binding protein [Priestia]MED5246204.1 ABC transporter ATP-binding protein [Priestia sp. LL-8]QDZ79076.1 ABC transporter ATP-binding protein [Priestia megaterium]